MDNTEAICLLNDSFPPLIDGVANTVANHAKQLPKEGLKFWSFHRIIMMVRIKNVPILMSQHTKLTLLLHTS